MQRILLVDDDDSFRKVLRFSLAKMGYDVVEARNGIEALKLYKYLPADVVLTDIVMPEKEGLETIRELKQRNPALRILAMSGGGHGSASGYLKSAQALGARGVLMKPFSNDEMKSTLANVMTSV